MKDLIKTKNTMDKLIHNIKATWLALPWLIFWNRAVFLKPLLGDYSVFVGFGLFIVGIIAFEYAQKWLKKGTKDWGDVIAGGIGALVVLIAILATKW